MAKLVALDQPQGPSTPSLISDIWAAGDAVCVIDQRLAPTLRQRIIDAMMPDLLLGPDARVEKLPHRGPDLPAGAALVVATSGTTSQPKAVVHTMDNLKASATATSSAMGVDPSHDHWICPLPISHIGGMSVITRSLLTGTGLSVLPTFEPTTVDMLRKEGANLISVVSQMLSRICVEGYKIVLLGGQNPPESLQPNTVATYGMTETGSGVIYDGRPIEGAEFELRSGEILLRGPMIASWYRSGDRVTDADGWLHTDDFGYLDPNGHLKVSGRISEMINTGAEKVFPHEVETELLKVMSIAECCVIGLPDSHWGEMVTAVVVPIDPNDQFDVVELKALLSESLPPWAIPKRVIKMDSIPRTALGKPQRSLLKRSLIDRGY